MEIVESVTKKISYNHLVKYDLENFLVYANTPVVIWCNGFLMAFTRYNIKTFEENILHDGTRCYDAIGYCSFPEYKNTVTDKSNNNFIVLNDSNNKVHHEIASFLKTLS